MVGHGRDQAGLASPGWAVEQVTPLPCLADSLVVILPLDEPVQVINDGLLQLEVHGKRVEGRWVVEVHRRPDVGALVHVYLESSLLLPHGLGRSHDEREVRVEGFLLVLLVEGHFKGVGLELLAVAAAAGVACGDAAVDVAPPELGAVVHVGHLLAVRHLNCFLLSTTSCTLQI
ncbi:hypothetical protein PAHAL_3G157400 [Panicum hallii]|uniref:Uncharacterized protein n=1 Tax=Panicum hallii TaxID=206008 RepID=A0A2S3H9F2_9POAL|nr:hypothetical protein PAHAL_3G157400 [Panicum hallii]